MIDSTFDLCKRPKKQYHKSRLIHEALRGRTDAEGILINRAATDHYRLVVDTPLLSDTALCKKLVEVRKQEYSDKKEELEKKFTLALRVKVVEEVREKVREGTSQFYEGFRSNVSDNVYGDVETSKEIEQFVNEEEVKTVKPLPKDAEHPSLRELSNSMSTMLYDLIELKRSLRFAEALEIIHETLNGGIMKCSKCGTQADPTHLTVLSHCGHLFCPNCLPVDHDTCASDDCRARNTPYQKVLASSLLPDEIEQCTPSKIDAVIDLIKGDIPSEDKVLVFVQFQDMLKDVRKALKAGGVDSCDLDGSTRSSRTLDRFQKAGPGSIKVMTLNIGDASAAGR